jgi:hypothetical protein
MGTVLLLALFCSALFAQSYMIKEAHNRYGYYLSHPTQQEVFYKSENELLKATQEILISFKQTSDITKFEQKYSLKLIERLSTQTLLYRFKNKSNKTDLKICEEITVDMDDQIQYVLPNFQRSKQLR